MVKAANLHFASLSNFLLETFMSNLVTQSLDVGQSQSTIAYSKLIIETLEQGVKYVQS